MLNIKNLATYYGQICALEKININVKEGEAVSVIGANGAGKSTLLKSIMGEVRPRNGTITLDGKPINNTRTYKLVGRGMTLVPEGRQVFPYLSVWDNLLLGGYTLSLKERNNMAEESSAPFPILRERKNQMAGLLSGGEQQMLAIARAMMTKPKILLLDEPSMGLSPKLVYEVYEKIDELHQNGTTILLVDQNAEMAINFCDRAYVLMAGRLVSEGTKEELMNSKVVQASYLG
ncbi:ABC transporter ATP-binding protein [Pseudogracilibacillus auburnensis]|uniref:Amino acid/amide ABC transporter ATP-binding protein 2 (HAAT family) n=1 Tax=Pseudogracilibacillus auburnensis TaxID=1494959 RepID=A0A2V3W221_9BACI|nr:ABC transporter ATP-binding protein [Pseudogracilibacillus auburnensis]MBO1004415.1 ABC transporter ATP-binding protein [Pseudogracilibacillus auburnensis]PXW87131.1 amino acid/amide ABC transporter ATP-binding protein 2 (HAAT family) [Pseudogracilibacillus auburnensis]